MPNWIKKGVLIAIGLAVVLALAIQLIPVQRTNPPVVAEPSWDSPETRALAKRACFDCHSNSTEWPWYSRVAPVSWLLASDVRQGRDRLNFSEWSAGMGGSELLGEVTEKIRGGEMPPLKYLALHPTARLAAAEKDQLLAGFAATFK